MNFLQKTCEGVEGGRGKVVDVNKELRETEEGW